MLSRGNMQTRIFFVYDKCELILQVPTGSVTEGKPFTLREPMIVKKLSDHGRRLWLEKFTLSPDTTILTFNFQGEDLPRFNGKKVQ